MSKVIDCPHSILFYHSREGPGVRLMCMVNRGLWQLCIVYASVLENCMIAWNPSTCPARTWNSTQSRISFREGLINHLGCCSHLITVKLKVSMLMRAQAPLQKQNCCFDKASLNGYTEILVNWTHQSDLLCSAVRPVKYKNRTKMMLQQAYLSVWNVFKLLFLLSSIWRKACGFANHLATESNLYPMHTWN